MSHVALNNISPPSLKLFFYSIILVGLGSLQGCAVPLAALSSSGTAAASSVGSVAAAYPVTTVSVASTATTGKSPLEHAASAATKKECSFVNLLNSQPVCVEITIPPITDKSEPLLGPADNPQEPTKH